jgi:hypothetical protein
LILFHVTVRLHTLGIGVHDNARASHVLNGTSFVVTSRDIELFTAI